MSITSNNKKDWQKYLDKKNTLSLLNESVSCVGCSAPVINEVTQLIREENYENAEQMIQHISEVLTDLQTKYATSDLDWKFIETVKKIIIKNQQSIKQKFEELVAKELAQDEPVKRRESPVVDVTQKSSDKRPSIMTGSHVNPKHTETKRWKSVQEDKLPGGRSDDMSPEEIAKKTGKSVEEIKNKIDQGSEDEAEHTNNQTIRKEIASDHIVKDPDYYKKAEKAGLDEEQIGGSDIPATDNIQGGKFTTRADNTEAMTQVYKTLRDMPDYQETKKSFDPIINDALKKDIIKLARQQKMVVDKGESLSDNIKKSIMDLSLEKRKLLNNIKLSVDSYNQQIGDAIKTHSRGLSAGWSAFPYIKSLDDLDNISIAENTPTSILKYFISSAKNNLNEARGRVNVQSAQGDSSNIKSEIEGLYKWLQNKEAKEGIGRLSSIKKSILEIVKNAQRIELLNALQKGLQQKLQRADAAQKAKDKRELEKVAIEVPRFKPYEGFPEEIFTEIEKELAKWATNQAINAEPDQGDDEPVVIDPEQNDDEQKDPQVMKEQIDRFMHARKDYRKYLSQPKKQIKLGPQSW